MSHQRAEQAIAAHAMQVTSDLSDTANELADVFSRLKASLQLSEGDKSALRSICELAGSKLGVLQDSLTSAAQAQGGMLQEMQDQVRPPAVLHQSVSCCSGAYVCSPCSQ